MGYLETQNAAWRATIADGVAGNGLKRAIKALQEKSQIKDSLADPRKRGAITAKRKTAKRTGSGETGDFTEISRAFHTTLRELRSASGVFAVQYYNVSRITTDRAVFNYLDHDPDA
jgi:hypothetical protein